MARTMVREGRRRYTTAVTSLDDEKDGPQGDVDPWLDELEAAEGAPPADSPADDDPVDVGAIIPAAPADVGNDDEPEVDVGLASIIEVPTDTFSVGDDVDVPEGPADAGLELPDGESFFSGAGRDDDGPDEDPALLLGDALPELGEDDGKDVADGGLAGFLIAGAEGTEMASVTSVATPWRTRAGGDVGPIRCIDAAEGWTVGAGTRVWFLRHGRATPSPELPAPAASVALVASEPQPAALVGTVDGRVLRVERDTVTPLTGVTEVLRPQRDLQGARLARAGWPATLLLAGDRTLAVLRDGGRHVTPLLGQSATEVVVALGQPGPPLAAVTADGPAARLRSASAGVAFVDRPLPEPAARMMTGGVALLAVEGDLVALGRTDLGLLLSTDGGASFHPAHHGAGITALTIGRVEGKARVLAVREIPAHDGLEILTIDPSSGRAQRLGVLPIPEQDGPVLALRYCPPASSAEPGAGVLLAAGPFGLLELGPPG